MSRMRNADARVVACLREGWWPIVRVACDTCDAEAQWKTKQGGHRCASCLADRGRWLERRKKR